VFIPDLGFGMWIAYHACTLDVNQFHRQGIESKQEYKLISYRNGNPCCRGEAGKTRKNRLSVVFLAVLFATLPQSASATLYAGWSPTPNISDSSSDAGGGGKDITGIWYAKDATNNYFRMDLNGAITSGDHANLYNIYVTTTPPGPGIPSGSDLVAMLAVDFNGFLFTASSYTPNGGSPISIPYELSNGNKTLEWSIPQTQLSGFFYYIGATISSGTTTQNDITTAAAAPIPSAVWLLGSGILGLVGLKRRQSKRP
jgi:hypothetical protein